MLINILNNLNISENNVLCLLKIYKHGNNRIKI